MNSFWPVLVDLTLRGSIVLLIAMACERCFGSIMPPGLRRFCWALVAVAFLIPLRWHAIPTQEPVAVKGSFTAPVHGIVLVTKVAGEKLTHSTPVPIWQAIWLAGVLISGGVTLARTLNAVKNWSHRRLSTDPRLLELLEECKAACHVTAPVGLVVDDDVPAPALLGWLRPKILLPSQLTASFSDGQIRRILFHELSHFRSFDICVGWAFCLVRILHWFNPLAWLASHVRTGACELAADADVARWSKESDGRLYAETLLQTLKLCPEPSRTFGTMGIVESMKTLKTRMKETVRNPGRKYSLLAGWSIAVLLAAITLIAPAKAEEGDPKTEAVTTMEKWLTEIDKGRFAESWKEASPLFQEKVSEQQWIAALGSVRTPLGKLDSRKLASALHQTEVPIPGGKPIQGDFVIAQFESSFKNLKFAIETVTFEKDAKGVWQASGYYIKPKT